LKRTKLEENFYFYHALKGVLLRNSIYFLAISIILSNIFIQKGDDRPFLYQLIIGRLAKFQLNLTLSNFA